MLPEDSEPAMHVLKAGKNHQGHCRAKSSSAEHRDQISAVVRIEHPVHIRHGYTFPREFCQSIPWSQMQTYCGSINERLTACGAGLSAGCIVKALLRIGITEG